MREDKNQNIREYVSEQIEILNKELKDKTLYMKNTKPDELSFMENIKEGDDTI